MANYRRSIKIAAYATNYNRSSVANKQIAVTYNVRGPSTSLEEQNKLRPPARWIGKRKKIPVTNKAFKTKDEDITGAILYLIRKLM